MYNKGISIEGDILNMCEKYDVIRNNGSFYNYKDANIGQGRENAKKYMIANPKVTAQMRKEIMDAIKANEAAA